ncbi:molybdopterin-guanine dinucleotide biosynthesis protein MobB [Methanomicrobium sp. W14]|uniref:molybdopterin-guanine dinucleotide biosynthesis protein B n=1 Tax=Methanomicrobium sp. W14 TaxID=2817839 RepID=UPI001AE94EFF|nr:molybdopterin-guanine dinucleotide biosynthesis protein B [Methanomicrobium sp. W14]MBP2132881.1 molybdopterin-guanine dinucleotide biosynthesis protein MobB [Methanomicrobium sp. W14]
MKIIHIVGHSNSGKTTFIHKLLDTMVPMFPQRVGVIKHMGHHNFMMEEGKDTTTHFEHGAYYVAGLDCNKAMVAIHSNELFEVLDLLSDAGIGYAIIEGFKDEGFKKIVKGDLEIENALMHDPSVDDVINSLDLFDDYYTLQGIIKGLDKNKNSDSTQKILSFKGSVKDTGEKNKENRHNNRCLEIKELLNKTEEKAKGSPGIVNAKFFYNPRYNEKNGTVFLVIAYENHENAFTMMSESIKNFKEELTGLDNTLQ